MGCLRQAQGWQWRHSDPSLAPALFYNVFARLAALTRVPHGAVGHHRFRLRLLLPGTGLRLSGGREDDGVAELQRLSPAKGCVVLPRRCRRCLGEAPVRHTESRARTPFDAQRSARAHACSACARTFAGRRDFVPERLKSIINKTSIYNPCNFGRCYETCRSACSTL